MLFTNITNVARYERKTLFRSWFFRIFSILALLIMFGMNVEILGNHGWSEWTTRAVAANIPYLFVLFINIVQAIIAVFLSADFMRRDKKLDTTEVIYTRPISNGEYVIGKTIGVISLFMVVLFLTLLMTLIFNFVKDDTPIVWIAYFVYPLLISIPTLIFILGLAFVLMLLVRNQAVTFIILLGYIGLTLFYFQDKAYGLFDYMAFNLPMVYSDFIGFVDLQNVLMHRLLYLFLGLGFIFASIFFMNRLPDSKLRSALNFSGFICFTLVGLFLGTEYFLKHSGDEKERKEFKALNEAYAHLPVVDILSNDLNVVHKSHRLLVSSSLTFKNSGNTAIDTIVFSLNPGFKVDSITNRQGQIDFIREKQIIKIIRDRALNPGRRGNLTIHYYGAPVENIAYLDIPKKNRLRIKRVMAAPIDKKVSLLKPNYVLLTPEVIWYPMAGVGFNKSTYLARQSDFARYSLIVETKEDLMAIAPGRIDTTGTGYKITPEQDLNAFSLIIGEYEKHSITVDDIEINLFIKPGHDYFSEYFTNIKDTLGALIKDRKDNYEIENLDLYYSFNRFNLVEVPVQFHAYERPQVQTTEWIMPEQIFIPEKGVGLSTLDFSRFMHYAKKRNKNEKNARSEKDMETEMFTRLLDVTFFRSSIRSRPMSGGGSFRDNLIRFGEVKFTRNPFCAFPQYYSYIASINSGEYPVFNAMLELYFKEGFTASPRQSFVGGMSDIEKANHELKEKSMTEIIAEWNQNITSALITQTGSFIILALKNRIGAKDFDYFLYYYIEDRAFSDITFEQFSQDFYNEFGFEIEPYFETIGNVGKIPSFLMSGVEYIQTRDDFGEVYLVRFKLTNNGEARGLVDVTFRMPGGFQSNTNNEQRLYELDAGETKDIQVVLYDRPRMMTVNTLISENVPSTFSNFLRTPINSRANENMEEYALLVDEPVTIGEKGDIIVDNEDEGFSIVSVSYKSKLKKYIESRKPATNTMYYGSINPNWSPVVWRNIAHSALYGGAIRSAKICADGDGANTATWKTKLPEAGFYDVYTYIPKSAMVKRPSRSQGGGGGQGGGQGGQGGNRGQQQRRGPEFAEHKVVYTYTVNSNEGSEDVEFRLDKDMDEGWNKIGTYHFPADTASVTLTNETNGRRVFADAIKWVKREK